MPRSMRVLHVGAALLVLLGGLPIDAAPSWKPLGQPTRGANIYTHLAIHPANKPVLVFRSDSSAPCGRCLPDSAAYAIIYTEPGVGWLDVGYGYDPVDPNSPQELKIAVSPNTGQPFVAYRDEEYGGVLSLKRWSELSMSWGYAAANMTTSTVAYVNLEFHRTLGPIMCFADSSVNGKASCLRFKGGSPSYVNLGSAGFSPGAVNFVVMALKPGSNDVFVGFQDFSSAQRGRVYAYPTSGPQFTPVGGLFSRTMCQPYSIAVNPATGRPYVAFLGDALDTTASNNRLTVVRFNGTSWPRVGPNGFAGLNTQYASLAFDPTSNAPWVAFQCDNTQRRLCVRAYIGSAWLLRGPSGLSVGEAKYITLKFYSSGVAYVAYTDGGKGTKSVVQKWS